MRALGVRIAVILASLALVIMIALDVAFLLWAQRQMSAERELALAAAAHSAVLELHRGGGAIEQRLAGIAATYDVVLTAGRHDESPLATAEVEVPPQMAGDRDYLIDRGFAHLRIGLPGAPEWAWVVASQSLQTAVDRVLATQPTAIVVLINALVLFVVLGLFFLRRAVLRPLARVTELASASDYYGLMAFGRSPAGGFAQLGRAISGMDQRIREDREQIVAQLAALTVAHQELQAAQEQLLRAERLAVVGKLAAGLAHEVGNPLAVVGGFVEMLQGEPAIAGDEAAQKALSRMAIELERMQLTIRQLLDFSRAPDSAPGTGDVGAALLHVEGLLRPQDRMHGIELIVERPAEPCAVRITTDALTQVLLNLAFNAADAMARDGQLRIGCELRATECRLWVDDSGPGITGDLRARIFEPFFTTKPAGAGTGLGLSVCERILTAAGGDITLEESPLGGARFTLALPLVSGDEELDGDQAVENA